MFNRTIPPSESALKMQKYYPQHYPQPYTQWQNRPKTKSPSWIYYNIESRHLMKIPPHS